MTLQEIERAIYRRFELPDDPPGATRRRILGFINEAYRAILSSPHFPMLRAVQTSITTVASRADYPLHGSLTSVRQVTEAANDIRLEPRSLAWYRGIEPDPQEGTPEYYISDRFLGVYRRPAATGVWAVSSSASDTSPIAYAEAARGAMTTAVADPSTLSATLTGTSRVQLGTLTDLSDVTRFWLSAAPVGDVSLYDASSAGNLLAVIPAGKTTVRYREFILWPTPSDAITYTLDCERGLTDLVNPTDEPLIPEDFHDLLILGARRREYEVRKKSDLYQATMREEGLRLRDLRIYVNGPAAIYGAGTEVLPSRLGPWFPAGSGF